jgi:hypothetical protein
MIVGDILSHAEICSFEKRSLQHGMNFRGNDSVFLMSRRPNAPYQDVLDATGKILTYEGHDSASNHAKFPRKVDQPLALRSGKPTPNGKFFAAAEEFATGKKPVPLRVRVYEKLRDGIWVFNGTFALEKAWKQEQGNRTVCKFELHLLDQEIAQHSNEPHLSDHTRMIPSDVKQAVYKRDKGKCVICGSKDQLHFDHDFPFSKGGASITEKNVRLLCLRHNLQKGPKIQ